MDWAPLLGELHPQVVALRRDFTGLAARAKPMIVTHRDIDPKNASLMPDGKVALFDWDYAGPRLLATELLDAAISFAGGPVDVDETCVYAAVDAYLDVGGSPVSFDHAVAPLVEEHFRWIMLNAWRSLGHRGVPRVQQEFAGKLVLELGTQLGGVRRRDTRLGPSTRKPVGPASLATVRAGGAGASKGATSCVSHLEVAASAMPGCDRGGRRHLRPR